MGRPPIGKVAMTSTERVHRFRAKHRTGKPETKHETKQSAAEIAALKQRIAELERRGEGQLTPGRRESRENPFTEVGGLRAEIGKLKSDIAKLKMALQEEPDVAKLRKKVVEQQVEMASLRRVMKKIAKERDQYKARVKPKYREARHLLTRKSHNVIINALHADRLKQCDPAELKEAHRLVTALRPLFRLR